jgi:hypothetical protein
LTVAVTDITHPVRTVTANSEWWNLPTRSFTDIGLTRGATYEYRLYVNDGDLKLRCIHLASFAV